MAGSRVLQLLHYSFFGAELGILKRNFQYFFLYSLTNYWNKMEFYVKCAIFSTLKWNFQNINTIIVVLHFS